MHTTVKWYGDMTPDRLVASSSVNWIVKHITTTNP